MSYMQFQSLSKLEYKSPDVFPVTLLLLYVKITIIVFAFYHGVIMETEMRKMFSRQR